MMACRPTLAVFVVFEHRKVDDPERAPAGLDKPTLMAELCSQRAQRVVDDLLAARAEENQVTGLRAGALENRLEDVRRQELDDRRLQPLFVGLRVVVDLDVRESLRAVNRHECGVVVDLLACELAAFGKAERGYAAARQIGRAPEYLEVDALHQVRQLGELERYAEIGLVGTV